MAVLLVLAGFTFLLLPAQARASTVEMIVVAEVTETTAIVKITVSEGSSANQINIRYRTTAPEGTWLGHDSLSVTGSIAGGKFTGLKPGTEYEIQVSPDQAFPVTDTASMVFTTPTPDPYVSDVTATNVSPTGATIDISIAYPCPKSNTVYVRYRTDDQQPWSDPPIEVVAASGSASLTLSQLSPGTGYTVEASLGRNFVAAETEEATFTTLVPRVSSVIVESFETSEATVKVTIADSGPDANTIHLRYGTSGSATATWVTLPPKSLQGDMTSLVLSGLTPGTNYTVQASLDGSFETSVESSTFTTTTLPTIGPATMTDVTDTTARVIVTILNSGQGGVTVYMRYRDKPDGNWGSSQTKTSTSGTTVFILSDLVPSTDYLLEVSLDNGFTSPQAATFKTQSSTLRPWSPTARVSGVYVDSATTSSAIIVAAITGPEGPIAVRLRYRMPGSSTWEATRTSTSYGANASFNLGGLTADTEYEIEAAVDPAFPFRDTVYSVFTTAVVRVSNIKLEDVANTRATVVARLNDPQGQTTVYLRYRIFGTWLWVGPQYRTTSSHTARLFLEGLEPDTEYEVEASTSQDFLGGNSAYATFATEPAPEVSDVQVEVVTNTGATVTALIGNPQGSMKAYLRLRVDGTGAWDKPKSRTTSTARASFSVSDLIPETKYEIEASLDREFPTDTTVQAFLMTQPNPKLSRVAVEDVSDKDGAVTVTLIGPQPKTTVFLRYRARGDLVWTEPQTRTTSLDTARFALSNLTPATEFEVEASLFLDFEVLIASRFVTTAKKPAPYSITGGPITQTTATIVVHIDNPRDSVTVHLRIRVWGSNRWRNPESLITSESTAPFDLTRLAGGTTYEIETSTESGFPSADTVSAIFTTAPATWVSGATVGSITGTAATVTLTIANSDGSVRTVHLRYRKASDDVWTVTETETSRGEIEAEISGLTPATDYIVETSLAPDFPRETTRSMAFGTLAPEPSEQPTPIPTPPIAAVYPDALEFTMIEDDLNPGEATLNIWNALASSDMEFLLVEDTPWLTVDPLTGMSTDPQDVVRLAVKAEAVGMKAGEYIGAIEVTGNAGNLPLSIPVTLTVTKPAPDPTPTAIPNPTSTPIPGAVPSVTPIPTYTVLPTSTPNPTTTVAPLPSVAPTITPSLVHAVAPTAISTGNDGDRQQTSLPLIISVAVLALIICATGGVWVYRRLMSD